MRLALTVAAGTLLLGCGTTGGTFSLGLADAEKWSGDQVSSTVTEDGSTLVECEGSCEYQRSEGWGFTEKFMGFTTAFLGRAVDIAAGIFLPGASAPAAPPAPAEVRIIVDTPGSS